MSLNDLFNLKKARDIVGLLGNEKTDQREVIEWV